MYGMRRIMYLQKYGVKSFPYRGRRRYKPSISHSIDGGIVISNDVFGLTIRQFERIYNVCLERRKTHEQWILNLRYPDKSSNEYLEYLQDCVYYSEDTLPWPGNSPMDKYLYEHLVYTIGTEMHMHNRQRIFIIKDMIENLFNSEKTQISSGSLAEGLDLQGSDFDVMFLIKNVDVIENVTNGKHTIENTTLVMEPDKDHPGFARLRFIHVADSKDELVIMISECCERTTNGEYASVERFHHNIRKQISSNEISLHGPCFSDTDQNYDVAICLQSKSLPNIAIPWVTRHRHQWPPNVVIDKILKYGCLLVPLGPRTTSDNNLLWRISFSVAEKQLVHSFNFTQLLCYGLLKLTLKRIINTNDDVKDLLCSYFLKTALFWVSEEEDIETFRLLNLFHCFFLCLDKLVLWINNCDCPNYFVPKHNMFLGKVDKSNNKTLQSVLNSIRCGGIGGLMNNLFPAKNGCHFLLSTKSETLFVRLDFLFYKTRNRFESPLNRHHCYELLQFVEYLKSIESSKFITDICNYYYGMISQYAAQMLPPPSTIRKSYNILKLYHIHLHNGITTDAVSGWLMYASFQYTLGQYNVALRLTEYVLSRCKLDMVVKVCNNCEESHINSYKKIVHSKISFTDRMKLAFIKSVTYTRNSPLIPEELKREVKDDFIDIPPVVMSFCLRFLCHHHLGDICNRQQALHNLCLTVKNKINIFSNNVSVSKTILGVCYEISGDINNANQCYDEALEDDVSDCS